MLLKALFSCSYALISSHPGGDPGDIRGHGAGFVDFCRQFLVRDWGIGLLQLFYSRIPRERPVGFVTLPTPRTAAIMSAPYATGYELQNTFQSGDGLSLFSLLCRLYCDASCVHDHDQDEMLFIVVTCNQIYRYCTITKNDSKSIGRGVYCNISPSIKKNI